MASSIAIAANRGKHTLFPPPPRGDGTSLRCLFVGVNLCMMRGPRDYRRLCWLSRFSRIKQLDRWRYPSGSRCFNGPASGPWPVWFREPQNGYFWACPTLRRVRDGRPPAPGWIARAGESRTVTLLDTDTGEGVLTLRGRTAAVLSGAFIPDGRRLASASIDDASRICEASIDPDGPWLARSIRKDAPVRLGRPASLRGCERINSR